MTTKPKYAADIGMVLLAIAILATLGGVWWWAILGMTGSVQVAVMVTVFIVGTTGVALVASP